MKFAAKNVYDNGRTIKKSNAGMAYMAESNGYSRFASKVQVSLPKVAIKPCPVHFGNDGHNKHGSMESA